ncbi:ABC transporter permease [Mycolicibacterium flavescens]|uniref:Transport permease protein n=1 Tax=Mycolicibacterium flavescens TaxID=1776 RepID=A0A1E3REC4_MYCFV|nr:ABC transporter permease [Mycolicibacterium flavescens]MCV7282682.1 ABC transporter permease [Mycolicibacterium flavescens]ODQ88201.1 ABC transporter [Mycolicibacterium flavescens]
MTALVALTERVIVSTIRDRDILFAVLAPVATFIGFTLVLQNVIDTGGVSYAQYVLPAVVVQAMLLGAMTTAERAAKDQRADFGVRLRTLPISAAVPLTARMLYCLMRGLLALVAAVAVAYLFGFRMSGGFGYGVAFVVVALLLTLALSLGADATGSIGWRLDAASQLLLVPQLLLVLLSTGVAPVESFPDWIEPFVQYQPISQVTETLRGFAGGEVTSGNLFATLAWCLGMLVVFGAIAVRMQRRTG